jgi:glycosyltransferase involved in cell wall biosynthesis
VHLEKEYLLSGPLRKLIEEVKPDVILAYAIEDHNSICLSLKNSFCSEIPIIQMIHSEVTSYYDSMNIIEKNRIRECSAIQALTPDFARQFGELIGCRVHAIPNIVEPPSEYADLTIEKKRKRIIMHSRLDKKKQQDVLLEAFALLKDDFLDWDLVLFGGKTTKGYLSKLHSIIDKHKMSSQVVINDATSQALYELCRSDIFAFPSVHEEGWGLVLTEAMSVGLPCVGIKSTAAINYLISSENAGLVSSNNVQEFSEQLRILMADQNLRIKYGNNAQEGMKKYYADEVCKKWEELFYSVIQKK